MITTIKLSTLFVLAFVTLTASKPIKNNELTGIWNLVKSQTNNKPNPAIMNDRTWKFNEDNTFQGTLYFPDGNFRPYNQGMFFLPNDTTMIALHSDMKGKLIQFSYTYNFHIKNDSLHLYGYYLSGVPDKPGMLQPMYIDEWWVKQRSSKK